MAVVVGGGGAAAKSFASQTTNGCRAKGGREGRGTQKKKKK